MRGFLNGRLAHRIAEDRKKRLVPYTPGRTSGGRLMDEAELRRIAERPIPPIVEWARERLAPAGPWSARTFPVHDRPRTS